MKLDNHLQEFRIKAGLTQQELAQALQVGHRTYQRYEYGERIPDVSFALRAAELFGTSVEKLWSNK